MFLSRFLTSSIWNACFICAMVVLKKRLRNRASLRFHYSCWYILIASLIFPFLPGRIWRDWLKIPPVGEQSICAYSIPGNGAISAGGTQWLQDSVQLMESGAAGSRFDFSILAVWSVGVYRGSVRQ